MIMGRTTTLEDRILINELARTGFTDSEIAQRVGWSRFTVRKWRRRGSNQGRQGVASVMGRPTTGALSMSTPLIRETLRAWRIAHPGWGPKTLRAELETDNRFKRRQLPSRTSIGRFLQEEGLIRRYERHSKLPQPARTPAQAPHQEWEMDARGHQLEPWCGYRHWKQPQLE